MAKWLENIKTRVAKDYKEGSTEINDAHAVISAIALLIGLIGGSISWYFFSWKIGVAVIAVGIITFYLVSDIGHKKYQQQATNGSKVE